MIKQEVLRQMEDKGYHELTVTGICDALDISRRTFYLHFYGIEEVFRSIFEEINEPLNRGFAELKGRKGGTAEGGDPAMVREIFQLISDTIIRNRRYLTRVSTDPSYSAMLQMHVGLMKEMIREYLQSAGPKSSLMENYLDYYISGMLELYLQWYRGVTDLTLEEIRDFACRIIETDMKYFLQAEPGGDGGTGTAIATMPGEYGMIQHIPAERAEEKRK